MGVVPDRANRLDDVGADALKVTPDRRALSRQSPDRRAVPRLARAARAPIGLRRQLRLLVPLLTTWAVASAVLAGVGSQRSAPLRDLFLDASYLGGQPWYSGVLNEVSVMAWTAAAVAAGFGAWISHRIGRQGAAHFLGGGALVSTVFLVDVWVQFHSALAPMLGLSSQFAELAQASLAVGWLIVAWPEIRRTRWLVLLAAFGALGVSATVDWLLHPVGSWGLLLEDGTRLVGVLSFSHYLVLTTVDIVRSVLGAPSATQPTPAGSPALTAETRP